RVGDNKVAASSVMLMPPLPRAVRLARSRVCRVPEFRTLDARLCRGLPLRRASTAINELSAAWRFIESTRPAAHFPWLILRKPVSHNLDAAIRHVRRRLRGDFKPMTPYLFRALVPALVG